MTARRRHIVLAACVAGLLGTGAAVAGIVLGSQGAKRPAVLFDFSERTGRSPVPGFTLRYLVAAAGLGAIPAIFHPRFDSPAEASRLLEPTDIVVGVDLGGDARAYPVKLLAQHEAVNDVVGGRPILVTWCPLCSSGLVFDRRVGGRTLTFQVSGFLYHANQVFVDRETRSLWSQLGDGAVTGTMRGHRLRLVTATEQPWRVWRSTHPGTRVLSIRHDVFASRFVHAFTYIDPRGEESTADPYEGYVEKVPVYYGRPIEGVSGADRVVAILRGGRSKVYPEFLLQQRIVVDDRFAGAPLAVFWSTSTYGPTVFSRRLDGRILSFRRRGSSIRDTATGSRWSASTGKAVAGPLAGARLRPLQFTYPYWFAWYAFHPHAVIARLKR